MWCLCRVHLSLLLPRRCSSALCLGNCQCTGITDHNSSCSHPSQLATGWPSTLLGLSGCPSARYRAAAIWCSVHPRDAATSRQEKHNASAHSRLLTLLTVFSCISLLPFSSGSSGRCEWTCQDLEQDLNGVCNRETKH